MLFYFNSINQILQNIILQFIYLKFNLIIIHQNNHIYFYLYYNIFIYLNVDILNLKIIPFH